MTEFRTAYNHLITIASQDERILGLVLAGSRAKDMATPESDLDVYVFTDDECDAAQGEKLKEDYRSAYGDSLSIDLSNNAVMPISRLVVYATMGTDFEWDRYNLVHTKIEVDKTDGLLEASLATKARLSPEEAAFVVERNLGGFINCCYRASRSEAAGALFAARLDTAKALGLFLEAAFALHGRVMPYNKYLKYELFHEPLALLRLTSQELCQALQEALNGVPAARRLLYMELERLARDKGYGQTYDIWGQKLERV